MGFLPSASFTVATGKWKVTVKAYNMLQYDGEIPDELEKIKINDGIELMAEGFADVNVKGGDNPVKIKMGLPKFEVRVGVVKGQDGKTLTRQPYGTVSVNGGKEHSDTQVYSFVKGTDVTITATGKTIAIAGISGNFQINSNFSGWKSLS